MQKIKISYILTFIVIIYAALFFIFPHTENLPADGGVKIRQVKDFIKKDYRSFSAVYNGEELDPDKNFFPLKKTAMALSVKNEIFYPFPFYTTLIFTPAYKLFGINGIIIICMIAGLLTILVSLRIAYLLKISDTNIKLILIFFGFASIIPIYSFMVAEYTLSFLFIILSIYLILLGKDKKKSVLYFLSGLSAAVSVCFRIELGLFCVLLLLGVIIFKIYSNPKSQIIALMVSLALSAIVIMYCNYKVIGNIFGERGVDFVKYSGTTYSIGSRLLSLFEAYFVSRTGIGLFIAWPLFVFIFILFKKQYWFKEDFKSYNFMLFITVIFYLCIPLIVPNKDGSVIGPRFLAPLQPLLILISFKGLELAEIKSRAKIILTRVLVVYSTVIILFGLFVLFRFDQISHDVNMNISKHAKNKIVILYDQFLTYSVFPLFDDRIIFTIYNNKDWEIIRERTRKMGIKDFTVIDFANKKESILYPFKNSEYEVKDRFSYHGNYRRTIVENIRFNN